MKKKINTKLRGTSRATKEKQSIKWQALSAVNRIHFALASSKAAAPNNVDNPPK